MTPTAAELRGQLQCYVPPWSTQIAAAADAIEAGEEAMGLAILNGPTPASMWAIWDSMRLRILADRRKTERDGDLAAAREWLAQPRWIQVSRPAKASLCVEARASDAVSIATAAAAECQRGEGQWVGLYTIDPRQNSFAKPIRLWRRSIDGRVIEEPV